MKDNYLYEPIELANILWIDQKWEDYTPELLQNYKEFLEIVDLKLLNDYLDWSIYHEYFELSAYIRDRIAYVTDIFARIKSELEVLENDFQNDLKEL